MGEATSFELLLRGFWQAFSTVLHIGGYALQWMLLGLFFIPLFVWIVRSKASLPLALVLVVLAGAAFIVCCGLVDAAISFGEAFGGGVKHYRSPTWYALSAITTTASGWWAWRRRRNLTSQP